MKVLIRIIFIILCPIIVHSQEFWDESLGPVGAHNISMISNDEGELIASFLKCGIMKYDLSNLKWIDYNNGIEDVYYDDPATYLCKLNDNIIASIENKGMFILNNNKWEIFDIGFGDLAPQPMISFDKKLYFKDSRNIIEVFEIEDNLFGYDEIKLDIENSNERPTLFAIKSDGDIVATFNNTNGLYYHNKSLTYCMAYEGEVSYLKFKKLIQGNGDMDIFAISEEHRIYYHDPETDEWNILFIVEEDIGEIFDIFKIDKNIYISSNAGIFLIQDMYSYEKIFDYGARSNAMINNVLYIATRNNSVYKTSDMIDFTEMKDGLYGTEVRSFSFDKDNNIYTATMNGIERLNNTSKEWELIGMDHFPDLNTWISMMAISVSDEGTIFVGSRQYGLYISRDNGDTFYASQAGIGAPRVKDIKTVNDKTYVLTGLKDFVYLSNDEGYLWNSLDSETEDIRGTWCFAIDSTGSILLGTLQGIYKYTNDWELNGAPDAQIVDMEINSLGEGYACGYDNSTQDYEIFYSDDLENWVRVVRDNSDEQIYRIACYDNSIYAGTRSGKLIFSEDKGKTWEIIDNTYKSYLDLKVIDGYLYAATTTGLLKSKTYLTISEDVRPKDEEQINVYPNPSNNTIEVKYLSEVDKFTSIQIYNIFGDTIYEEEILVIKGENSFKIEVNDFDSGLYIIIIDNSDLQKLIKID